MSCHIEAAFVYFFHGGFNAAGYYAGGGRMRKKCPHLPAVLNFVTRAVANFVHALTAQEDEEDKTLLLDIFSLPADITVSLEIPTAELAKTMDATARAQRALIAARNVIAGFSDEA